LRALTNVFSEANAQVVENAVSAANALGALDRCADVRLLRAVVPPPEDAETRSRVDNLRDRVAALKARFDSGRWKEGLADIPALVAEAKALGYQPLVAEILLLQGSFMSRANDAKVSIAEQALREAYLVADASRHDEVRAEAATYLVYVVGYQQSRFVEALPWAEIADAVLKRVGGHDLLQAWLLNDLGAIYTQHRDLENALQVQLKAVQLKERVLGRDHPDVGMSEDNVAIVMAETGRHQEALEHVDRSVSLLEAGLGAGHPDVAIALSNRGEILNALGRYSEVR